MNPYVILHYHIIVELATLFTTNCPYPPSVPVPNIQAHSST